MEDMYRLDFSRGTVEKIDSRVPPRGWRKTAEGAEREQPPPHAGYSFGSSGTAPRVEEADEEDSA